MPKWCVEFEGSIEIEADTEEEAERCAWEKLVNDGPRQHLMADACADEEDQTA